MMRSPWQHQAKVMRRKWSWSLVRMVVGSALGIIGFGTLSSGFVDLSVSTMVMGVIEILVGTFFALGVLSPLRRRPVQH